MFRRPLALLAAAAATLVGGEALAYDPRLPLLGREPSAAAKVQRFRTARAGDAEALAALEAAGGAGVAPREQIHRALLATNGEYAAAFAGYEATGDNVEDWRVLLSRLPKEASFARAHATYLLGRSLLRRDDLEAAANALEAVRGRHRTGTPWTDEATFFLGYIYARLPGRDRTTGAANRSRARHLLQGLLPEATEGGTGKYAEVPERLHEGAVWLLRELRGEGMGPLLELAKRMDAIERLIARTRTGQPTQEKQEQVLSEIDRLIALMREKEQGGGGQGQGQGQGNKPGQGGNPSGNRQSGGPANQSQLQPGEGRMGEMAEGPRGPTSEEWGNLEDREREEAIQFLREKFPTRYREIIERYYRAIAEEDN